MHEVYVMDKYRLGMRQWFEKNNPSAQAQVLERMLEAIRKGYWDASDQTRREIVQSWSDLAAKGITSGAVATRAYAAKLAEGYGLQPQTTKSRDAPAPSSAPTAPASEPLPDNAQRRDTASIAVRGQLMRESKADAGAEQAPWRLWIAFIILCGCLVAGALRQARFAPRTSTLRPNLGTP
jgi:cobaltochelatase CobN